MTVGIIKATDMIKVAWRAWAPFAYGRYIARGRGGVLIAVDAVKLRAGGEGIVDTPARYVTNDDISSGSVNIPPDTSREFEIYDPEKEVVFLFDDGKGIATYRGAAPDQPSPKELYEVASASATT